MINPIKPNIGLTLPEGKTGTKMSDSFIFIWETNTTKNNK